MCSRFNLNDSEEVWRLLEELAVCEPELTFSADIWFNMETGEIVIGASIMTLGPLAQWKNLHPDRPTQ